MIGVRMVRGNAVERNVGSSGKLRTLFRVHWRPIALTYSLFNVENLLHLAQPLVLGLAINGLIRGSMVGLGLLVVQHLAHLAIGTARRMYDTRVFSEIYNEQATRLVCRLRTAGSDVSTVAARSALSRELVDFFEYNVPQVFAALYGVIGALAMLAVYDVRLAGYCLLTFVPLVMLNRRLARDSYRLNSRLNDRMEKEVGVVEDGRPNVVRRHYHVLAGWRIRLSDLEALNFARMEVFILGLVVVSLSRFCSLPGVQPGDIYAVFAYVLMFVGGLDQVPTVTQQMARLHDIGERMDADLPASGSVGLAPEPQPA